jgi:cell division protein FtsB
VDGITSHRLLALARAAVPPRLERRYRNSPSFRRRVHRALRWSWLPVLCYSLVFTENGLASILVRLVRIHRLEHRVTSLERRNDRLRAEIVRREDDPEAIERLARERYGMAYPGEKVVRIVEITPGEARRLAREKQRLEDLQAEGEGRGDASNGDASGRDMTSRRDAGAGVARRPIRR